MQSIMEFFRPVRKDKRKRGDAVVDLTAEEDSHVAPAPPPPSKDDVNHTIKPDDSTGKSATTGISEPRAKRQAVQSRTKRKSTSQDPPPPTESVYAVGQPVELSEYEQKRQAKMAANAKFLEQLGMSAAQLNMTRQLQSNQQPREAPVKRPKRQLQEVQPVRRSRRLRGETAPGSAPPPRAIEEDDGDESAGPDPFEVEASFAESNVLRYSVNGNTDARKAPPLSTMNSPGQELVGFKWTKVLFAR